MRRSTTRTAACALSVALALGTAVVPCAAEEARTLEKPGLATLSASTRQMLARAGTATLQQQPPAAVASSSSSFFKSKKGAITLALMGAGTGFALYSIHHDRQPVKSKVR